MAEPIKIKEVQEFKKNFPQYATTDDVTLLRRLAAKAPTEWRPLYEKKVIGEIRAPRPTDLPHAIGEAAKKVPAVRAAAFGADMTERVALAPIRALFHGMDPIKAAFHPDEVPSYVELTNKWAKQLPIVKDMDPLSQQFVGDLTGIAMEIYVPLLAFGVLLRGAGKVGAMVEGKRLPKAVVRFENMVADEFVLMGMDKKAATKVAESLTTNQAFINKPIANSSTALNRTTNLLKANKGRFGQLMKKVAEQANHNAAAKGFGQDWVRKASARVTGPTAGQKHIAQTSFVATRPGVATKAVSESDKLWAKAQKSLKEEQFADSRAAFRYRSKRTGNLTRRAFDVLKKELGKDISDMEAAKTLASREGGPTAKAATKITEPSTVLGPPPRKPPMPIRKQDRAQQNILNEMRPQKPRPTGPIDVKYEVQYAPKLKERTANMRDKQTRDVLTRIDKRLKIKKAKADTKQINTGESQFTLNPLVDTRIAMQDLQERTGIPMYDNHYTPLSYQARVANHASERDLDRVMGKITEHELTGITEDMVANFVETGQNIELLSAQQKGLADRITAVFEEYRPKIKYVKMRRLIDGTMEPNNREKKLVEEAAKIFRTKGPDALKNWVNTKDFGVIDDGYLPKSIVNPGSINSTQGDAFAVSNPHVKSRTGDVEIKDTRRLMQRIYSYLKRVNADYYMYDDLKDLKQTLSQVEGGVPPKTMAGLSAWVNSMTGRGIPTAPAGRFFRAVRGQFFKTIFAADMPHKYVRNRLQNIAYLTHKYPVARVAQKRARLHKPTPKQTEFFDAHIDQLGQMLHGHFALQEVQPTVPVLREIDKAATAVAKIYPLSDKQNRWLAFRFVMSDLVENIRKYQASVSGPRRAGVLRKPGHYDLQKITKDEGLYEMYDLELRQILNLPPEEAALEIARLQILKTHWDYTAQGKGIGSMSELGEYGSMLFTFPKGAITESLNQLRIAAKSPIPGHAYRGAIQMLKMHMFTKLAAGLGALIYGTKKYYDQTKGEVVTVDPYSLPQMLAGATFAGAQPGQLEDIYTIIDASLELVGDHYKRIMWGKSAGLNTEKQNRRLARAGIKSVDRLGKQFGYFYDTINEFIAAFGDLQTHGLTQAFDKVTENTSAIERNEVDRNLWGKIRKAIFGTG